MSVLKKITSVIITILMIIWVVLSMMNIQLFDIPYKRLLMIGYVAILALGFLYETDKHKYFIRKKINKQQVANIIFWAVLVSGTIINLYYWKATIYMLSRFFANIGFDIGV